MARRWTEGPHLVDRVIVLLLAVFVLGVLALSVGEAIRGARSARVGQADWPREKAAVAARLHQRGAPDFGRVWRTRKGVTCGLVDGAFSFGGVLGMIPFYVEHGRPVFGGDVDDATFDATWRGCLNDMDAILQEGTMVRGRCGTRRVRPHCRSMI